VLIGRAMTISIYWSSFVTSYKFFFKNDEKNFQKIGCASHSQSTKKNIIEAVGELPMYNITLPKEQKNWKKKIFVIGSTHKKFVVIFRFGYTVTFL
jgi:hypothetical protein